MRVIYIAGPFRAPDAYGIRRNVRKAEELALEVWRMKAAALCPHLNTANFQGCLPDRLFLEGDLDLLRRCDAVLLVKGWERSEGTNAEVQFAEAAGIPVFEDKADLAEWLEKKRMEEMA